MESSRYSYDQRKNDMGDGGYEGEPWAREVADEERGEDEGCSAGESSGAWAGSEEGRQRWDVEDGMNSGMDSEMNYGSTCDDHINNNAHAEDCVYEEGNDAVAGEQTNEYANHYAYETTHHHHQDSYGSDEGTYDHPGDDFAWADSRREGTEYPDTPHAQAQEHQHEAGPSPAIAYMLRDEVVQGVREGRARIALAEVFGCVSETPHDVAFRELINQLSSDEVAEMFRWLYYDLLERLGNEH